MFRKRSRQGRLGVALVAAYMLVLQGLFGAFAAGDLAKGGLDVGLLLIGAGLLWTARRVHRHVPAQRRVRVPRATTAVAAEPSA